MDTIATAHTHHDAESSESSEPKTQTAQISINTTHHPITDRVSYREIAFAALVDRSVALFRDHAISFTATTLYTNNPTNGIKTTQHTAATAELDPPTNAPTTARNGAKVAPRTLNPTVSEDGIKEVINSIVGDQTLEHPNGKPTAEPAESLLAPRKSINEREPRKTARNGCNKLTTSIYCSKWSAVGA